MALPSPACRRHHDLTPPTEEGTTQTDHVFVSVCRVFMVETKSMGGWNYGRKWDRQWSQVFPSRGGNYRFQNPLRQNHGQVRPVEDALAGVDLPDGTVNSVVLFVCGADLKRHRPENVTVGRGGFRYIPSFKARVLSKAQVAAACAAIRAGRLGRWRGTERRHARHLRARHDGVPAEVCPQCGRAMVLRTARRGRGRGTVEGVQGYSGLSAGGSGGRPGLRGYHRTTVAGSGSSQSGSLSPWARSSTGTRCPKSRTPPTGAALLRRNCLSGYLSLLLLQGRGGSLTRHGACTVARRYR